MKKIMALGLAVVFMVSMVLTGCGKSAGTGQEEAGKGGKVKIRFASWDSAEDLEDQQKLVDAFNEQHDDIEVVLEAYGSDFDTKIAAGMGSGDAPDVMYMWNYPDYYEAWSLWMIILQRKARILKRIFMKRCGITIAWTARFTVSR